MPLDSGLDATTGGQGGSPIQDASSDGASGTQDASNLDGATDAQSGAGGMMAGGSGGSETNPDAEVDAGHAFHLCYVDGCNGEIDSIPSAPGCPAHKPTLATSCALPNGAECFYCEPGEERIAADATIPAHVCSSGTWTFEELFSACD